MISHAIRSRLVSEVTLAGNRVYPLRLPQNPTYPAITYQRISTVRYHAMVADRPEAATRVQVNVWASRYDDAAAGARQVADQVRTALQRWSGTAGGQVVIEVFPDNEFELYEAELDLHRVILDFIVWAED